MAAWKHASLFGLTVALVCGGGAAVLSCSDPAAEADDAGADDQALRRPKDAKPDRHPACGDDEADEDDERDGCGRPNKDAGADAFDASVDVAGDAADASDDGGEGTTDGSAQRDAGEVLDAPEEVDAGESGDASELSDAALDAAADVATDAGPVGDARVCTLGWCWHNPLPQGGPLGGLAARDATDVWTSGRYGVLLRWDGGAFRQVPSGTSANITVLWAATSDDVWAGTADGAILHFDGSAWTPSLTGAASAIGFIHGSAANDVWAAGTGVMLHWDGSTWSSTPTGNANVVYGLWAASPADAWVGGNGGMLLRWDGSAWSAWSSPATSFVSQVWGTRSDDVWASGSNGTSSITMHFDGFAWQAVSFGAMHVSDWYAGTGPSDIWALGSVSGAAPTIVHGDGATWTPVSTALPFSIHRIAGASGTDAWVVSENDGRIARWDGIAWTVVAGANVDPHPRTLQSVWGASPDDLWAIGRSYGNDVLHWNGSVWSLVPLPVSASQALHGSATNDVWIVGDNARILHWDGSAWSVAPKSSSWSLAPSPPNLVAVWSISSTDAWAVGNIAKGLSGNPEGWIAHWNGSVWDLLWPYGGPQPQFIDLSGAASNDVWLTAVGGQLWHFNGTSWSVTPSPSSLQRLWARAQDDVWATGIGVVWHYDGISWTSTPLANVYANGAIRARSPTEVWAMTSTEGQLLRFDGASWRSVSAPVPPLTFAFPGGADDGSMWAVGNGSMVLRYAP